MQYDTHRSGLKLTRMIMFDLALLIIDVDVFCKGCRTRYLLNKLFVDQFLNNPKQSSCRWEFFVSFGAKRGDFEESLPT